jgi:hypothetical protein
VRGIKGILGIVMEHGPDVLDCRSPSQRMPGAVPRTPGAPSPSEASPR